MIDPIDNPSSIQPSQPPENNHLKEETSSIASLNSAQMLLSSSDSVIGKNINSKGEDNLLTNSNLTSSLSTYPSPSDYPGHAIAKPSDQYTMDISFSVPEGKNENDTYIRILAKDPNPPNQEGVYTFDKDGNATFWPYDSFCA